MIAGRAFPPIGYFFISIRRKEKYVTRGTACRVIGTGDAGWQRSCPLFGSAMDAERENAGLASAFFGAVGYVAGGLASPLVGAGNIFITSSVLFVVFTSTSWLLSHKSRNC